MDEFLKKAILAAGAVGLDYFNKGVSSKTKTHLGDLVTQADYAVSDFLIEVISKAYPEHGIYSEELSEVINPKSDYLWMIDPIDGTRNFANHIPFWCTLVALWHKEELVLGAAYNPVADQLFFAEKGKGATFNGKSIHVNSIESLDHSFGCFVRGTRGQPGDRERFKRASSRLVTDTSAWPHNFGTMFGMCFIASGGVDFYFGNGGLNHDYAAPALICREAGALVTDCDGKPWQRDVGTIVIANPKLHAKVLELLK